MKISLFRPLSLLALTAVSLSANADDAFNNIAAAPNSYILGGDIIGPRLFLGDNYQFTQGLQFTTTRGGSLAGFQLAMNNYGASVGQVGYSVTLLKDNGSDRLGSVLGTFNGLSTGIYFTNTTSALSTVDASNSGVTLTSNTKYWLIATGPESLVWSYSLFDTENHYSHDSIANTTDYFHMSAPALSVQVTDPVPEPASIAALGLGTVACLRRRKRG